MQIIWKAINVFFCAMNDGWTMQSEVMDNMNQVFDGGNVEFNRVCNGNAKRKSTVLMKKKDGSKM